MLAEMTKAAIDNDVIEFIKSIGERDGLGLEYYLDYRDRELDPKTLAEITEADDPEQALDEMIWEWEIDLDDAPMYERIIDEVKREFEGDFDDTDIVDACRDVGFYVFIDRDQFLDHNNIMAVMGIKEAEVYMMQNWGWSGTGRLIRTDPDTQHFFKAIGTSMTKFVKWYNKWTDGGSPKIIKKYDKHPIYEDYFFYSLYREFNNMMYDGADVVMLLYPTLREFIEINNAKEFIVNPGSMGFVNFYPGSGSVLEIYTAGIKLKREDVWWCADESMHYSVQSIFGLSSSAWEGEVEILK